MPLSPAAYQLAESWVSQHCPNLLCAGCGAREWAFGEMTVCVTVPGFRPGLLAIILNFGRRRHFAAMIPLTCEACGYTVFFAPSVMGIPV